VTPVPSATVTIGIDIGTTSVKAVAADGEGNVVARERLAHRLLTPEPDLFEHQANRAWAIGPRRAVSKLNRPEAKAVAVAAMVPSMTAVSRTGVPVTAGLLYGDRRGRTGGQVVPAGGGGEALAFLRWAVAAAPDAAGFWPAPAVANYALGRRAVIDVGTAFTTHPLFSGGWDEKLCAELGIGQEQLPEVAAMGAEIGKARDLDGAILAAGSVDAICEQLVAGADHDGDVLVLCGTTLIVWAVIPEWREVPGLWSIPHTAPGKFLIGGASNAGGLFLNWADRLLGRQPLAGLDPHRVPVWVPYIRGERTPYHDPDRRAALTGLDLTNGPGAARRAAYEAAGFVVRHHLDLAGSGPKRLVATGGGTRVRAWMQALADATGLPVDVAAVPEGAALGAAFLGRMALGLESNMADASRWARTAETVEPDPKWIEAVAERYVRFRELSAEPGGGATS
jgi:xylulokinase